MINLAAPIFYLDGLTVFRDDVDPLQFYFYPIQPRLATNEDGTPTFLFVKFAAGDTPPPPGLEVGGGFLQFDADLKVDQDLIDETKRKIRQQMQLDQDPNLVPVQCRSGTTRLIFLDAQPQAVPAASAAPTPTATQPRPATPAPSPGTTSATTTATSGASSGSPLSGTAGASPGAAVGQPPATATPSAQPAAAPGGASPDAMFRFVENANYSATPALIGDNRTAFSVELSQYGAQLVEQCLDAPTFLAGVVYDLTFVGLRPAFNVDLKIDWDRVYDFMEHQFHVSAKVAFVSAQADIDNAVEKLIEQRAIELKVVNYAAGPGDQDIIKQKDDAVDTVKKMITDTFFTPSIPPTAPGAGMTPSAIANSVKEATSPVALGYSFKHVNREDVKHLTVNFAESDAMEVHIVPQGHLAGLMDALKQFPRSDFIRSVKFDDPFFERYSLTVAAGAAIAGDHIDSMIVNLRYGDHEPRSVAFDATKTSDKVEWAFDPSIGWAVQYDVLISFNPDAPVGKDSSIKAGPFAASGTKIEVNPRNFYALLPIEVHAVAIPWDHYAQIEVDLEYIDANNNLDLHQTLILNSAAPNGKWPIRLSDPGRTSFRYRTTFYPTSGPSIQGDWQDTDQPIISVRDVFSDVLKVTLVPAADFTKVLRFMVTMAYRDPANAIDQNDLVTLNSPDSLSEWSVRIIDRGKRAYTYAVTTFYRDGTVVELPPVPASGRLLTITGKYNRPMHIALAATGASFAAANLDHVDVALSYDDPANSQHCTQRVTLRSTNDTGSFDYTVVDPTKPSYNYEVTWFGTDGFMRHQATQPSTAERLVIPIGA